MYGLTRGELNNNPCNIRKSGNTWLGKIISSQDKDFEQFDTAIDGIRAAAKLIISYYRFHQLSTITQIVSRWAPTNENDTSAYINDVAAQMPVAVDESLNLLDATVLAKLVKAIIHHENGECIYSDDDILAAANGALNT